MEFEGKQVLPSCEFHILLNSLDPLEFTQGLNLTKIFDLILLMKIKIF